MKEASQTVIENARIMLFQSLLAENAIDVKSLDVNDVEDLKLAVDATLVLLKRVILAPIQETLGERNLCLPINQLPLEILERIFQEYLWLTRLDAMKPYSVYKYGTSVNHQAVLSLALVSKRWHHIVFGTPSMWTLVSLAMPHAQIDKWLSLSGSHPLDVYYEIDDDDDIDPEGFLDHMTVKTALLLKFAEAVTSHLGRTRLFRVAVTWGWIQEILPMLSTSNEAVETLELHLSYPRSLWGFDPAKSTSLALFKHHAPKLTCIEITSIQIDWRGLTCFPALQTLKLSTVTIPTSCIENGLHSPLDLRVLELHNVFLDVDVPASGLSLDLPNLQTLVCTVRKHGLPRSWETPLISRIRSLRSLESVHLSLDLEGRTDMETYVQANIADLSSDFSRILGSAACLHVNWDGHNTSINNTAGSFSLGFATSLPDFHYGRFRDIVLENGFSGDVDLSVRNNAMNAIQEDTWKWPHLNVSRLTLIDDQQHYSTIPLESVSQILMSLGDFLEDRRHWSTLRCIRLDFKELRLDRFAGCLKKRYTGTDGDSIDLQHLNIYIRCWENSTSGLEELRGTHGVASVILEERGEVYASTPWDDEGEL